MNKLVSFFFMNSTKGSVYNITREIVLNRTINNVINILCVLLIIINVLKVFLDTFDNIRPFIEPYYFTIDLISIIFFTVEFILRVWTSDSVYKQMSSLYARLKYISSPKSIIDLISLISFYLPLFISGNFQLLRLLRLFRIFSLLKINRYSKSLTVLGNVFKNKGIQLISSFIIVFILMIFASLLMYYVENYTQPETFKNAFSSLWWVVATLTTVGYGDIYPITLSGQIIGIFVSLMGVGLIAIPTGIISVGFIVELNKNNKSEKPKHYCQHCGKRPRKRKQKLYPPHLA